MDKNNLKTELISNKVAWIGTVILGIIVIIMLVFFVINRSSKSVCEVVKRETVEPKTAVIFQTQVPQASLTRNKESSKEAGRRLGLGGMFKADNREEDEDPNALETLYSATEAAAESEVVAPYGRLLSCETVLTIDSSNTLTPIVGLVTEDLWYAGKCIIPAGTEVHGTAQAAHLRDRIMTGSDWTLVWVTQDKRNGRQLPLKGLALDRDKNDVNNTWSLMDGTAGIRGTVLKSDELAEMKLFGATFLGGVVAAIQEPHKAQMMDVLETGKPSVMKTSLQTATAQGTAAVIERYAEQVMETLEKEAFFIRIPAGKQFYLYIQQPIDLTTLKSMK